MISPGSISALSVAAIAGRRRRGHGKGGEFMAGVNE